jgi:uncharacterized protein (DUF1697 family)
MPLVVFMRAVNVGGHKRFQPSTLAKQLAHLGVINVGAAGTFVVPGTVAHGSVRHQFQRRLPFAAEMMICPGRTLIDLAANNAFSAGPSSKDLRQFVSVMSRVPRRLPPLPLCQPEGERWEVKVIGVSGRFAVSLFRRLGKSFVDPNGVVEKGFDLRATTRNWNTIAKICDILKKTQRI